VSLAAPAGAAAKDCSGGQLHVSLHGLTAGLGHAGLVIRFRNNGSRCTMHGYPGVDGVRHGHAVVHARRTRGGMLGGGKPRRVVLRPGDTASSVLEGTSAPVKGRHCAHYRALRITPPNTTKSVVRRVAHRVCYPEVHPVVFGKKGGAG
jgi:hypothetical protein